MYRKDDGQISIEEFMSPFGKLNPENRWVKIANIIPWQKYEEKYAKRFCKDNGAPAIKYRMAMGALIIKQRTGHSDDEVLMDIQENPYMQYLIGLHAFTEEAPFAQSSITNFRKYITAEMINEINEELFRGIHEQNDDDNGKGGDTADDGAEAETFNTEQPVTATEPEATANKGTLMLDATCAPAYIRYPTDISLLNEAREKLEGMIDTLHPCGCATEKPRTYRRKARRAYLGFAKQRKPRKNVIRKAIGQQLRHVKRDLQHVDRMLVEYGADSL